MIDKKLSIMGLQSQSSGGEMCGTRSPDEPGSLDGLTPAEPNVSLPSLFFCRRGVNDYTAVSSAPQALREQVYSVSWPMDYSFQANLRPCIASYGEMHNKL